MFGSVVLGRLMRVMFSVQMMAVGRVRVVCGFLVIACFVMFRRFFVMRRGVSVMCSRLFVVIGAFMLSHGSSQERWNKNIL